MVDPRYITNFNRTQNELEELILFCVCAAGHNAMSSAKALDRFLASIPLTTKEDFYQSPFVRIKHLGIFQDYKERISSYMKAAGIGCNTWRTKARTFFELATFGFDLKKCTIDELEQIHGIGRKTSRFFMLHTRPNMQCAVLDTHILKYMRDMGYDVPKNTPSTKKSYELIESQFLELANASGQSVADFDLNLWNRYAGHVNRTN